MSRLFFKSANVMFLLLMPAISFAEDPKNVSTSADTKAVITAVNHYLEGISKPEMAQESIQKAFYSRACSH